MRLQRLTLILLSMAITMAAGASRRYLLSEETRICDLTLDFPAAESLRAVEARFLIEHPVMLRTGLSPSSVTLTAGDYSLTVGRETTVADYIDDGSTVLLTLRHGSDVVADTSCPDLARDIHAFASYALETDGDTLRVMAGTNELRQRIAVPLHGGDAPGRQVSFTAEGCVRLALIVADEPEPTAAERLRGLDPAEVSRRLAENIPKESPVGSYTYLDRVNNPSIVRPGGRYHIAVVPDDADADTLLIIYISGAVVEPSLWRTGMLKGRMKTTPFVGQYDLEWFDAHGDPLPADTGAYAVHNPDTGILTLSYPLLGEAQLRFVRH